MRELCGMVRLYHGSRRLSVLVTVPFIMIACSGDRIVAPPPGGGPQDAVAAVSCQNGCQDTFTDADETPLEAHSPDVGGFTWRRVDPWAELSVGAKIRSNAVVADGADTIDVAFAYQAPEIVGEDTVQTEVELFGDAQTMRGAYRTWILLRGNGTDTTGYEVAISIFAQGSTSSATVTLVRNTTQISEKVIPYPAQGIHKLRAEVSGGVVKAYFDGVLVNSFGDGSPLPAGNPGFGLITSIAGYGHESQVRITSFEVKPCPPTGDVVLENASVGKDLEAELIASRGNGGTLAKQERTGWIYQDTLTSQYFVHPEQDPGATDCGNTLRPPQGIPGAVPVRPYHTHPSYNGEKLFGCRAGPGVADRSPKWGGGSPADWMAARSGSMYVLTYDQVGQPGKVYRLDPGLASTPAQWGTNPNKWQFTSAKCLKKIP